MRASVGGMFRWQSIQEALRLRKKTITAVVISVFAVAGLRD
jgi:hypothetical protein